MNSSQKAIMIILSVNMPALDKFYTKASMSKILELLEKRQNITISRRCLNYHMKGLVDKGYITRKVRTGQNQDGFVWKKSSIFAFTIKGADHLIANKIEKGILIRRAMSTKAKQEKEKKLTREDYLKIKRAEEILQDEKLGIIRPGIPGHIFDKMPGPDKKRLSDLVKNITKSF